MAEEENKNANRPETATEAQKPTNWWKIICILLIVAIAIFSVVKLVEYAQTNNQNNDGSTHITSRSAKNSDIAISTDTDWSSLGTKIIVTPKTDINGLRIKVVIQDKNKASIYTTEKYLGNVQKNVQTSCSVTLSELGWSNSMKAEYVSVTVSGGTVSYLP